MSQKGFTLVELLITIVIVSILAGVAIPSYRDYVTRGHLVEAYDALGMYRINMEQSYQDSGTYATAGACSIAAPTSDHFNYACALTNGGQGFTVTATGNGTNSITGYVFTLNDQGARTTTAFPGATVPASCWLTKSGGC